MSQDDPTKYEMNQQRYNHYHQPQYPQGPTNGLGYGMKYEHNKRSSEKITSTNNNFNDEDDDMLYENFLIAKRANGLKQPYEGVDLEEIKSTQVNYEYQLVPNGSALVNSDNFGVAYNSDYENLDKRILLQKYFRTALVGPRENIYENLCRGCNYGVFSARGPLCSFCECIVNGVTSIAASPAESSNNIYENICAHCAQFYSGNAEDDECPCRKPASKSKELQVTFCETKKEIRLGSVKKLKKIGSDELLLEDLKEKKQVKIRKSKSFNKPKILTNFLGSLKKAPKAPKKPLEIVHHVEGYEQVFHTKETFDLQRICELKRSVTSCSDQHIYGRLKPKDFVQSQEDFLSTQSLVQTEQKVKRSRISKPKFLRSLSSEPRPIIKSQLELCNAQNPQYYLNPSVCLWMTSLRREVFNANREINTCRLALSDEDSDVWLCCPKSIPARNLVNLSCKLAPSLSNAACVSNRLNTYEINENHTRNVSDHCNTETVDLKSLGSTEIVATKRHLNNSDRTSTTSLDALQEDQGENQKQQQQQQVVEVSWVQDHYQQMVDEFKFHLQNKYMKHPQLQQQQQQQQQQKYDQTVNHDMMKATGGRRGGGVVGTGHAEIPLRHTSSGQNHNKAKRQGMYLRLGEQNPDYERVIINNSNNDKNNNNSNSNINSNSNDNSNTPKDMLVLENVNNSAVNNSITRQNSESKSIALICKTQENAPIDINKRLGIHERNILQAFEALLVMENNNIKNNTNYIENHKSSQLTLKSYTQESQRITENQTQSLQTYSNGEKENKQPSFDASPIIIVDNLINQVQISCSLNTVILTYDHFLCLFLHYIVYSAHHREKCKQRTHTHMLRLFRRFYSHCCSAVSSTLHAHSRAAAQNSITAKLDLMKTNGSEGSIASTANRGFKAIEQQREIRTNDSFLTNDDANQKTNVLLASEPDPTNVLLTTNPAAPIEDQRRKPKQPPEVPKRDPTTKLSPTKEQLPPVPLQRTIMTVPTTNLSEETKAEKSQEENIYQPIWKFKTLGEVQERFKTDADYYEIKEMQMEKTCDIPQILISEEDHSEWEPDEEFVFSSQPQKADDCDSLADKNSTIRSNRSNDSSFVTTSSLSGSTITDFASSTATLASCVSASLMHHLFRNIGIFYSLTEPKLRAIIYDYDRIHSSKYFCKPLPSSGKNDDSNNNITNINDSGLGKSPTPKFAKRSLLPVKELDRNSSSGSSNSISTTTTTINNNNSKSESVKSPTNDHQCNSIPTPIACVIPKSVELWKQQLLNVNYMEDEEDMIVSESEILRAQKIKEDVEPPPQAQPQLFIQRFKSRSTDNILDLPLEDDKRSFGDRVRDKLQRGILNINNKSSPKSEKRLYKAIRNAQTTSLYLEEGLTPKYPIFEAPLTQLELNQTTYPNVPRFVVDSVEYIERKDRINQDGLYRACGNKFSIDELKQKLSKSYIYDPKLIAADDIHTIASLLKQFFRDLPHPLIPQETYNCLARDLALNEGIDAMRIAINEMPEPNKSTLAFLIKHLTNVAACSSSNRMNASNLAIVWGPSLCTLNEARTYDIGRMNTLAKVLIENYNRIFQTNERLL